MTKSSLQPSSIPTYTRAWKLFDQFHSTLFQTANFGLPITPANLALFIAYLFERNYAHSTVNTYISALSYSHKLLGLPDPTRVFYIIQMLKGYGKTGSQLDSRLPITLPILQSLLEVAPRTKGSSYQICQFKAMCSLAFFAFLRMGEITTSKNKSCQPLQLHQLAYVCDSGNPVAAMKLTFHDFKHHYNQRPFTLIINRQQTCCPIKLLLDYLALRGRQVGAIFVTQTGAPVTRDAFTSQLSEAIRLCGLDPSRYKGHSFRIGAASHAAEQTRKFASSVVGNQTLFRSTFGFKQCLRSCYSFYFSLYEHGKALAGSALALFRLRYFVRNACTGGISTEYLLCFFLIHEHEVERTQEVSTGNFLRLLIP